MPEIDNATKELLFRYPKREVVSFGRQLSCAADEQGAWTTVHLEASGKDTIAVMRKCNDAVSWCELDTPASYHQPSLVSGKGGWVAIAVFSIVALAISGVEVVWYLQYFTPARE